MIESPDRKPVAFTTIQNYVENLTSHINGTE